MLSIDQGSLQVKQLFETACISVSTKPILSVNQQFVETRQIIFGNVVNIALEKLTNLRKYDIQYFHSGLVQNLQCINIFSQLWVQFFHKNVGTHRSANNFEETLLTYECCFIKFLALIFF